MPNSRLVEAQPLPEPVHGHVAALARRAGQVSYSVSSDVREAALEYLAWLVDSPDTSAGVISERHGVADWELLAALPALRQETQYRAYLGEWIGLGRPTLALALQKAPDSGPTEKQGSEPSWLVNPVSGAPEDLNALPEMPSEDECGEWLGDGDTATAVQSVLPGPTAGSASAAALATQDVHSRVPGLLAPAEISSFEALTPNTVQSEAPGKALPSRWISPYQLYDWQWRAAAEWESRGGHGIMQVVTGAGKTLLALYLYARLLDRHTGHPTPPQLIVIVPRVALVEQWRGELSRTLDLNGLEVGVYHGEERCLPSAVDILIITQDSARNVLPRVRSRRSTLLIADECHRLGAPAASQVFERSYDWTLGLSATPERGGDFGFETVLIPNLGPVVWTYGYGDAVRDGIIARFRLGRLQVRLTAEEMTRYLDRSTAVKQLNDALRRDYPSLRGAHGRRYFQVFGDLRNRNPGDERFDAFTAAATDRRNVVHLAAEKMEAVRTLSQVIDHARTVLIFHELVDAANEILVLLRASGIRSTIYHSNLSPNERRRNLGAFRNGSARWLVACRSLDEGLDIPAVDTVILVSGTKAPRQVIQRLGRALRRKDDGREADVLIFEVAGVDDGVVDQDQLSDLRLAALADRELTLPDLGNWLRPSAPVSQGIVGGSKDVALAPPAADSGARSREPHNQHRAPSGVGRLVSGARQLLDRIVGRQSREPRPHRSNSWTGTPGTVSYYDKDSSPD